MHRCATSLNHNEHFILCSILFHLTLFDLLGQLVNCIRRSNIGIDHICSMSLIFINYILNGHKIYISCDSCNIIVKSALFFEYLSRLQFFLILDHTAVFFPSLNLFFMINCWVKECGHFMALNVHDSCQFITLTATCKRIIRNDMLYC